MLNPEEIKTIVAGGEGYNAEFKLSLPSKVRELTEEICAFANAAGGVLLIGVDDRNVIQGIKIDNSKRSSIQNSIKEISPNLLCQIDYVKVDGKEICVIDVPSGPNKPYVLGGAIFVRIGPNSQKLTLVEEMRDFFQQADRIYFDEGACPEFDPATEIDAENLKRFREAVPLADQVSDDQIFRNLKLFTTDGSFKNGAVLFFGLEPSNFFEKAVIRCVAFGGTDKRYIEDDKVMTGPLYSQYQQTIDWLRRKLDVHYDIEGAGSGPRNEVWEIPQTVFKEAIINALSHRDYYDKGGRITVEVFDDRVEISNPGGLVSAISASDFGRRSHNRNPLIFGLFERMRMVEQIGSGIVRMRDLLEEAGLPSPTFTYDGIFTVTVKRPVNFERWIEIWLGYLTENRVAILRAIRGNQQVSKRELEEIVGIGSTAIDNNLAYLRDLGLLKRIGTKGGRWMIRYIEP
jgi:ATP-dependent DNA helicase RecG